MAITTKQQLVEGLAEIDKLPLVQRSIGLIQLQEQLGYNQKQFELLVRQLARAKEQKRLCTGCCSTKSKSKL